jgi:hypothetical protein
VNGDQLHIRFPQQYCPIGNLLLRIKVMFVGILATSAKCRDEALIELGGCSVEDGSLMVLRPRTPRSGPALQRTGLDLDATAERLALVPMTPQSVRHGMLMRQLRPALSRRLWPVYRVRAINSACTWGAVAASRHLLQQHRADQPDDRAFAGEILTKMSRPAALPQLKESGSPVPTLGLEPRAY